MLSVAIWKMPREYRWDLPETIPRPGVPADNPMSDVKVELGRWLFYDTRLSVDGDMSCGHCHFQDQAFTEARGQALGTTGELHPRGSMSLMNAAYAHHLTRANPLLDRLEIQALTPLFGEAPVRSLVLGGYPENGRALRPYLSVVISQGASLFGAARRIILGI